MSVNIVFFRCPLETSEESEKPTEVSRRLFAYFLVGEKVGPRRDNTLPRFFVGTADTIILHSAFIILH